MQREATGILKLKTYYNPNCEDGASEISKRREKDKEAQWREGSGEIHIPLAALINLGRG